MKHKSYRALALGLAAAQLVPFSVYSAFAETNEAAPKSETAPVADDAAAVAENDQIKDTVIVTAPTFKSLKEGYAAADVETKALVVTSYYSGKITVTAVTLTEGADKFEFVANGTNVEVTSDAADSKSWTIKPKTGLSTGSHTGKIQVAYKYSIDSTEKTDTTTCDITFVVAAANAKDLNDATVTLTNAENLVYDGTEKKPGVSVTFEGATEPLVLGTDYTVEYADNINAGTATVTVVAKDTTKYVGSKTVEFSIAKKQLETPKAPTAQDANITDTSIKLDALAAVDGGEAKYSKDNGATWTTSPEFTGLDPKTEYSFTAMYEAVDTTNYISSEKSSPATFTTKEAEKKNIADATVTLDKESYPYTGEAIKPVVTVMDGTTELVEDTDYTLTFKDNTSVGTATITITGKGDYEGTKEVTFVITKGTQAIPIGLKMVSATQNSITLTADAVDGKTLEYARLDDTYKVVGSWNTTGVFEGLVAGTEYIFTARFAETGDFAASEQCTPITVSTAKAEYKLTVDDVTFEALNKGYDVPAALPIVIRSDCENDVTIDSVTVDDDGFSNRLFEIEQVGNDKVVPAGQSLQSYQIKPVSGLQVGEYSPTIHVKYYVGDPADRKYLEATATATFEVLEEGVKALNKSNTTIEVAATPAPAYTGSAITPDVTVKYTESGTTTELVKDTDYTVEYTDNINAGTATVTITGTNTGNGTKYGGEVSTTFEIKKANQTAPAALELADSTFNSIELKALAKSDLGLGAQYSINKTDWQDNPVFTGLEADTEYTFYAKYPGDKNHFESSVKEGKFKTAKLPDKLLVKEGVTLAETEFTYDKTPHTPAVTVKVGEDTLVEDTHYTVTYANNTNAGTATVTVKAIEGSGYTGEVTVEFTIKKADQTLEGELTAAENGITKDSITLVALPANTETKAEVEYKITPGGTDWVAKPEFTGLDAKTEYTISARYKAVTNYNASNEISKKFTTADETGKLAISNATITVADADNIVYTGSAIEPEITVELGGTNLVKDTDYEVAYADNVDAGEATITVTAKGDKYTGTATANFTIKAAKLVTPKAPVADTTTDTSITLKALDKVTGGTAYYSIDNGETWTEKTEFTGLDAGKEYEFVAYYKAADKNHTDSDVSEAAKISTAKGDVDPTKVDIKDAVVTIADADKQVYDGTEKKPAVTVTLGETALNAETDYSVDYTDNVNAGTATVTVTGKGNYTGTATASFNIAKADQPAPAVPELSSKSKSSITIKAVADSAVTGAKAEYSIDEGETWQDDTTFTGLRSSRRYEIIARYKATDNYNESSASDPLTVTTSSSGSGSGGSIGGGGGGSYRPSRPSTPSEPSPSAPTIPGGDSGWSNIGSDIGKSEPGSNVTINLNGDATVPADVLVAAANKDVKLTLKVDETYTWEIDGANISGQVSSADFSVKNDTVPAQAVTNPALMNCDSTKAINVTGVPFAYKPVLTANFGTKAAGEFVNLYKVDPATGALEFAGVTQIGADGNAVIPVTENGKYVIAVDNETKMMGDFDNSMGVNAFDAASLLKEITSVQTTGAYKGDVDGDGKVDVWDAVKILKMIVGLE